ELQLQYIAKRSVKTLYTETISWNSTRGFWHRLGFEFSKRRLRIAVDCRIIVDRQLQQPLRWDLFRSRLSFRKPSLLSERMGL
uniref:N-acetyltransferase domain-containing protein n=1 Tax=Macrostomum lignano TaxID=282301 RepID=A0A1I8JAN8_9PLAT